MLEANHDEAMLRIGPYPEYLKRRVLSNHGHLSNADCGRLLAESLRDRSAPRTVWLAHLSATNNRPALARRTVAAALAARGAVHAVEPLARHGHHQTWRPGEPVVAPVQLAMMLDWSR